MPSLFAQCSFLKRNSPIALYKRVICSFSWANCSFAHKKRAIRSKNRRAKSQPWFIVVYLGSYKLTCHLATLTSPILLAYRVGCLARTSAPAHQYPTWRWREVSNVHCACCTVYIKYSRWHEHHGELCSEVQHRAGAMSEFSKCGHTA